MYTYILYRTIVRLCKPGGVGYQFHKLNIFNWRSLSAMLDTDRKNCKQLVGII